MYYLFTLQLRLLFHISLGILCFCLFTIIYCNILLYEHLNLSFKFERPVRPMDSIQATQTKSTTKHKENYKPSLRRVCAFYTRPSDWLIHWPKPNDRKHAKNDGSSTTTTKTSTVNRRQAGQTIRLLGLAGWLANLRTDPPAHFKSVRFECAPACVLSVIVQQHSFCWLCWWRHVGVASDIKMKFQ